MAINNPHKRPWLGTCGRVAADDTMSTGPVVYCRVLKNMLVPLGVTM
jgi:hypothetical protein